MYVTADDGVRLNLVVEGPETAPSIVLMHSIGCDHTLWDAQAAALAGRYCVVRYDARGHGGSDAPLGDYTIERLGRDTLAVLDAVGAGPAYLCGLSLGGTTAQWLALNAAGRLRGIVLANTAARIGSTEAWQARADAALGQGMEAMADVAMSRFFSDGFRKAAPGVVAGFRRTLTATAPHGYAGCCAVLRDSDFSADLGRIAVPTMVIAGRFDLPIPLSQAEALAAGIPGAKLTVLDAGHLANIEQPGAFTAAILKLSEMS